MSKKLKLETKEEIKKKYTSYKPSMKNSKNAKKINMIMSTNALRKSMKDDPEFKAEVARKAKEKSVMDKLVKDTKVTVVVKKKK